MKKFTAMILIFCLTASLLAGCGSSVSYTFDALSGEKGTVTLDTSDGHEMTQEGDYFIVTKDGAVTEGFFVDFETYDDFVESMGSSHIEVLEMAETGSVTHRLYAADYGGITEWGIILWLEGTDSGVYMYNTESEASIRDAFAHLSFSAK